MEADEAAANHQADQGGAAARARSPSPDRATKPQQTLTGTIYHQPQRFKVLTRLQTQQLMTDWSIQLV